MRFIRRLMYFIAALSAILSIFIIVCAYRPDITDKIAAFLYPEQKPVEMVTAENSQQQEAVSYPAEDIKRESTDEKAEGYGTDTLGSDAIAESVVSDYVLPEQSEIVVPENVSGRNGYQQVQENSEQIDDEAAGELQNYLDTGYAGDGLDFDAVRYPYYAMLDNRGKSIYRQIYANAKEVYPVFMPVEQVTLDQLRNIFSAVYNDHPELFWLETAYSCKYRRDGSCVEIELQFNRTVQNLDDARAVFEGNASQIVSEAQNLSNDYEKEKFVHDELIEKVSYNLGAEMNQSAYSALVNGQTVCAGYARAYQYLLQQLGIPCYYCTGYAGERHAWNIVALDDGYYNVDATWDDSGNGQYDYFNKTDADYASSHIRQEWSWKLYFL